MDMPLAKGNNSVRLFIEYIDILQRYLNNFFNPPLSNFILFIMHFRLLHSFIDDTYKYIDSQYRHLFCQNSNHPLPL